ncbi:MAG: amidophosphoribosyltransferase [bacterium]
MEDIKEKCGVFGVYGRGLEAARLTFFGLFALQHRGQESSGITVSGGERLFSHKGMGLVMQVFAEKDIENLAGHAAIGHNRYSTTGGSLPEHIQPFVVRSGTLALAHNGNLPSTKALEEFLASRGKNAAGFSDSKLIIEAISVYMDDGLSVEDAIAKTYPLMTGAFSIVILTPDKLIALRDSYGIRPLSLARLNGGFLVASETCAFNPMGAVFERDVRPGEMLVISEAGLMSRQLAEGKEQLDAFEFVYFSRTDSVLMGRSVYEARRRFGEILAREADIEVDIVVPIPETGIPVAAGYAAAAGITYEPALAKSRYIQRTFIAPDQHLREQGVKMKLSAVADAIRGKRVAIADDSIVRGTTSKQIVAMLFEAGAKEVHFLVSSPPVRFPDFYGIDTPRQDKLLAANHSIEEMREYLGATSLHFLSVGGLIEGIGLPRESLCLSCFTGEYPIDLGERAGEVSYR